MLVSNLVELQYLTKQITLGCMPSLGCALTSVAMLYTYFGYNHITPHEVLVHNGWGCFSDWEKLAKLVDGISLVRNESYLGLEIYDIIRDNINRGIPVIVGDDNFRMSPGKFSPHWVLAIGYDENRVYILNPLVLLKKSMFHIVIQKEGSNI